MQEPSFRYSLQGNSWSNSN